MIRTPRIESHGVLGRNPARVGRARRIWPPVSLMRRELSHAPQANAKQYGSLGGLKTLNWFSDHTVTSRPRDATLVSFPLVRAASPDPTVRESCVERVVAVPLAYHTCPEDIVSPIGTHPRLKVKEPARARLETPTCCRAQAAEPASAGNDSQSKPPMKPPIKPPTKPPITPPINPPIVK